MKKRVLHCGTKISSVDLGQHFAYKGLQQTRIWADQGLLSCCASSENPDTIAKSLHDDDTNTRYQTNTSQGIVELESNIETRWNRRNTTASYSANQKCVWLEELSATCRNKLIWTLHLLLKVMLQRL